MVLHRPVEPAGLLRTWRTEPPPNGVAKSMFQKIPLDGKMSQKKNGSKTPIINCGRTFLGPTMASTIESRNKATIAC